jgi:hypothetical protein
MVLPRREFLILGATAVAGLTMGGGSELFGGPASMPLLSVGYWNGSPDDLRREDPSPSYRRIVAAETLAADSSLSGGNVEVTIHGFWRASQHRLPLTMALRAHYPPVADVTPSLIAWVWEPRARMTNQARFEIPLRETLDLTVERVNAGLDSERITLRDVVTHRNRGSRSEMTALSSRSGSNGVKLRRGMYFLAIRENDAEPRPAWSSMRVLQGPSPLDAAGEGVLRTAGALDRAPFSYLVLSIDRARA